MPRPCRTCVLRNQSKTRHDPFAQPKSACLKTRTLRVNGMVLSQPVLNPLSGAKYPTFFPCEGPLNSLHHGSQASFQHLPVACSLFEDSNSSIETHSADT